MYYKEHRPADGGAGGRASRGIYWGAWDVAAGCTCLGGGLPGHAGGAGSGVVGGWTAGASAGDEPLPAVLEGMGGHMVYKHYAAWHMVQLAGTHGNPRFIWTYADESENRAMKKVAQSLHSGPTFYTSFMQKVLPDVD